MENKLTGNRILIISLISSLFTLFILNSCSNHSEEKTVLLADKLLDSRPDSAFILLESIDFPEDMPEETYAGYCRLLVLVHQKNRISIKSDTLIHKAVNYYKDRKNKHTEYIQSLLLSGNVYEAQDSTFLAEQCYLEAFELSGENKDSKLYGISAYELGGLHKYLGNYDKGIYWFNIAAGIFETKDDRIIKGRIMRQTADCFALSGHTDTALVIYNKVLSQPQSPDIEANVYKNMAVAYKKAGHYDNSLHFIRKSIETSPRETLYPIQYLILSSIYEDTGKQDSAIYYKRKALQYAGQQNNLCIVHKAYEAFYGIHSTQSFENYILSKSFSNSDYYQKQKHETVIYQRLYNIEKVKKRNRELTIRLQRCLFFLVFISFAFVSMYLYHRNSKKKKLLRFEKELEDKNTIINTIMDSLYQRLVLYKKMVRLSISPNKDKHKPFLREYNKVLFDKKDSEFTFDWDTVYDLTDNLFNNYTTRINHLYPLLNDTEKKIIILLKIGFTTTEIASILNKSVHTMYKYTSNIRKSLRIPETQTIVGFIDGKL